MYEELEMAYGLMIEANYRPAASGDGFGHITGTPNLVTESLAYAQRWAEEEDKGQFSIGTCGKGNRVAIQPPTRTPARPETAGKTI